jgi:predicted enzyme related to lactoylglutathione lyase
MHNSYKSPAIILTTLLLLAACAGQSINLPSITSGPTGERLPGKIVWRDLLTSDPAASQRFYAGLFGWEFERSGPAYTLIRHNGKLIGGMVDTVALNNRRDISQWVVVMAVEDIDAAVGRFEVAGGEVVTAPTDVGRRGALAVVRDAEGALLGLLQTTDGDPVDRKPAIGDFLWDELWTTDVDKATDFYEVVSGLQATDWDTDADQSSGASYRLLQSGDTPRVGIMPNPVDGLDPVWVSYLRVESPSNITARVADLGGRVLAEAQPRPLGGEVALIAGPSGAGIALQTWPLAGE